jgi:hypothetical protein
VVSPSAPCPPISAKPVSGQCDMLMLLGALCPVQLGYDMACSHSVPAVQAGVLGFVHYPHATTTELAENAVAGNGLTDHLG